MCWRYSFPKQNGLARRRIVATSSSGSRPSCGLDRCHATKRMLPAPSGWKSPRSSSLSDSTPPKAQVSNVEELLRELDARDEDVARLTIDLIAAPSPNPPGDESAPAALIVETCRRLGLPQPVEFSSDPRRPNLLLTIEGSEPGPHLAFCGHTDTKPVGDAISEWKTDPYLGSVIGDRLYGLGS